MRLSTKIILWAWAILILIIGSLIYSAYSKLKPDSLISLLNSQIENNYAGSKLSIGNVRYSFSLDFQLTLSDLRLRKGDKILATAQQVELKVPWWLILLERGSAQVNLNNLTVFIRPSEDTTEDPQKPSARKETLQAIKLSLPTYLRDAIYTLRAKNILIQEQDGVRKFFSLSKLLVRDFQYGKNSAFEMNIPVSISHKEKKFSSDLWLFGDITPGIDIWSFNYRGEFRTKDAVEGLQIDDLVLQGEAKFNPLELDIVSDLDLKVDQKTVGSGSVFGRDNKIIFDLNFTGFPISYLNLVGDELKNPFLDLKKGRADGKLKYVRSLKSDDHSLISSKLNFNGDFNLSDLDKFNGQWSLSIENDKWETNFISPKGEVSFFRRSVIDFEKGQIKQAIEELGLSGIDFNLSKTAIKKFDDFKVLDSKHFSSSFISLTKCKFEDKLLEGSFKYSTSPFESFYHVNLEIDKSKLDFKYIFKNGVNAVQFDALEFKWNSEFSFLQPYFKLETGIIDGKLVGTWSDNWIGGKWESSLKFSNYKKLSGYFFDSLSEPFQNSGIDFNQSQQFLLKARLEKNVLRFLNSSILATESQVFDGIISFDPQQKSFLDIKYSKNKFKKVLRKEFFNPFIPEG